MVRRAILTGLLAATLVMLAPKPQCVASTLPAPAAKFLHYFACPEAVEMPEAGKTSVWERFVVSLILATSAPETEPATSSPQAS
jgi:hypothetical protein